MNSLWECCWGCCFWAQNKNLCLFDYNPVCTSTSFTITPAVALCVSLPSVSFSVPSVESESLVCHLQNTISKHLISLHYSIKWKIFSLWCNVSYNRYSPIIAFFIYFLFIIISPPHSFTSVVEIFTLRLITALQGCAFWLLSQDYSPDVKHPAALLLLLLLFPSTPWVTF